MERVMHRTTVNGIEIEFETAGAGEPVLLIHGAFIADTFHPLMAEPALTGRFLLVNMHRRGYAGSSHPTSPVTISDHAADCRALISHLGVERAHVAGHSYGGAVALQLAVEAPQIVQSIALLEPSMVVGASGPGYREMLMSNAAQYREVGAERVVHEFVELRWPGYRPHLERLVPGAMDQAVADAPTWYDRELASLMEWQFGENEAGGINLPVLSILGGDSQKLAPRFVETHEWLERHLSDSEGVTIPGTTHFMLMQDVPATARALSDFWSRHPIGHARS
jgi:pimeloyl-ACP methyl ester carboxylesterase